MPKRTSVTGSELFIVDNSDKDWKVVKYLHEWCQISKAIDIATGFFEIGSLLALDGEWQKVDQIRILMGGEVSRRTKGAFEKAIIQVKTQLDGSVEEEKEKNDFLDGVPAIVEAIRSGKILCRIYRKEKFHAKAYITHARLEVVGSSALVGSSNLTKPGLTENVELNVQITGAPVSVLQEWYEEHWNEAEDVTPEILNTIERHILEYMPFDVYARSLHEFFQRHEMTDMEWLENKSKVYPVLDKYQKDGFLHVMEIAARYRGAFLCDGVGLGKTYVGLMIIEYLLERQRKRVVLLVPKAAREPVWGAELKRHLPHVYGDFSNLVIINHTDLLRKGEFPEKLKRIREMADAFVIDEAHHFRNPGLKGEEDERKSRYWQLYDLIDEKNVFLLTATPVNNQLIDLQHEIELFSQRQPDFFKDAPLGIHSLAGHFRKIENELEKLVCANADDGSCELTETNQAEAERVLADDSLFRAVVVQRSRAFVKKSQELEGKGKAIFPDREPPRVANYKLKKTYGKLLDLVEVAFSKKKPLFSLAVYYPLAYYRGPDETIKPMDEGRQRQVVTLIRTQFLKRFESSARAFEMSCETLMQKLIAWIKRNEPMGEQAIRFDRWLTKNTDLVHYVRERQMELWGETPDDDEQEEDIVPEELILADDPLPRDEFKVDDIINETIDDLYQLSDFLNELKKFKPASDDKLQALIKLLKTDPVLKKHKVIIFTEYMATARYLKQQLAEAGIEGLDEVDSNIKRDRGEIIQQFSPFYNGLSTAKLAERNLQETRVLISTDVLSEGLNLQDATRIINYDIHWNPVRLMQRIGRVDRRMNPGIEEKLLAEHPDQKAIRGTVVFWNFLPPDELDSLLHLYSLVAHKTLRISRTFGIEGRKLLTPEDDYEALKDFTRSYEGTTTPIEEMYLEYERLLQEHPGLIEHIRNLPGRVFSGKEHLKPDTRAVFFCYALPVPSTALAEESSEQLGFSTEDSAETRWYLFEIDGERIDEDPSRIVNLIRSTRETPRRCMIEKPTLTEIRQKVEKHIKNTYLKQVQAPIGVKPILKAWMELN